ncbi:MAG: anthranilate synthase component I, partial [Planctomycetaceae bacterium]
MPHLPDRARFADLARTSRLVPVYRRLFADSLTPLTAYARLDDGAAGCLFESVVGGENVGRHSFLAADPFLRLEARGREVRITGPAGVEALECDDPLAELERRMAAYRPARLAELPPFTSGAVGCVAYDAVRYVERLPHAPPDDLGLPDLSFAFYDRMVVFDHVTKGVDIVVLARIEGESASAVDAAYDVACRRVDETIERLAGAGGADARRGATPSWPPLADIGPRPVIDSAVLEGDGAVRSGFDRAAFEAAVERAIEYIRAGDVFQVVL